MTMLTTMVLAVMPVTSVFASECVVLLHGLLRSASSMSRLEERLENAGFAVVNIKYSSRASELDDLAEDAVSRGLIECQAQQEGRVHFVSHSLGGILVRQYFSEHSQDQLGRVVMLGPPNHGSEVVDYLRDLPGYTLINGPAASQLGTEIDSPLQQLGPVNFELGVIAGTVSINPLFNLLVPDPNDGTVSVASTRVEGMRDHLVLPVSHSLMMFDQQVIDNVVHFLVTGRFIPVDQ